MSVKLISEAPFWLESADHLEDLEVRTNDGKRTTVNVLPFVALSSTMRNILQSDFERCQSVMLHLDISGEELLIVYNLATKGILPKKVEASQLRRLLAFFGVDFDQLRLSSKGGNLSDADDADYEHVTDDILNVRFGNLVVIMTILALRIRMMMALDITMTHCQK